MKTSRLICGFSALSRGREHIMQVRKGNSVCLERSYILTYATPTRSSFKAVFNNSQFPLHKTTEFVYQWYCEVWDRIEPGGKLKVGLFAMLLIIIVSNGRIIPIQPTN